MVRTPTKADEVAISSASAGIIPSSSSSQLSPLTAFSFRSMWTESGLRPTTNRIVSPAAAISGTVKQQSKSYVRVSLTYDIFFCPTIDLIYSGYKKKYLLVWKMVDILGGFYRKPGEGQTDRLALLCGCGWCRSLSRTGRPRRWNRNLRTRNPCATSPERNGKISAFHFISKK